MNSTRAARVSTGPRYCRPGTDWIPPSTCGDSTRFLNLRTDPAGVHAIPIPTGLGSTLAGCLRIEAGAAQVDAAVVAVPQFGHVQVMFNSLRGMPQPNHRMKLPGRGDRLL